MPKRPRAKITADALKAAADELEARLSEHDEALRGGKAEDLDGAAVRALQAALSAVRSSADELERAQLVSEWTADRAAAALEALGLDDGVVTVHDDRVDVTLPRGGTAQIAPRAATEAAAGFTVSIYGSDVTGTGGHFATALHADDDAALGQLVSVLAG